MEKNRTGKTMVFGEGKLQFFKKFLKFIRERVRVREGMSREGRRGVEEEEEADFPLSGEPDAGLNPRILGLQDADADADA